MFDPARTSPPKAISQNTYAEDFPGRSLSDKLKLKLDELIEDLVRGCPFYVLFWTSKKGQKKK